MTNSAENEFEAVIWWAMTKHKVTTMHPVEFIETIKQAAMDYAAGDSDALTATRRVVLHEASRPRPRQTSPGVAEGGGQPRAPEQNPSGSGARPPGGATLSTGSSIPYPGQGLFKLRPQPVDNDWWAGGVGPDDDLPGSDRSSETTRGTSGPGSTR